MENSNIDGTRKLSQIPAEVAIYLCGDKDNVICGLNEELVAHRCNNCIFCKTQINRNVIKTATQIYYRKTKSRPS